MRKRIIEAGPETQLEQDAGWLNLARLAEVEITSEDPSQPIEAALLPAGNGWRAASAGTQTLRLKFDQPQQLRRIWLSITESQFQRTQELLIRWSPDRGKSFREIVRQQWNFSPHGSTREVEDYRVELDGVTVLELTITPDLGGGAARASLDALRLA